MRDVVAFKHVCCGLGAGPMEEREDFLTTESSPQPLKSRLSTWWQMDAEDNVHFGGHKAQLDLGTFFKNQDTALSYCCRFDAHRTFLFICFVSVPMNRGQKTVEGVGSLPSPCSCTRDGTQLGRLGCRPLCLLSHFAGPHKHELWMLC